MAPRAAGADPAPFAPLPARREYLDLEVAGRGIRFAEATYPAGLFLPEHAHRRASITVVVAGGFEESGVAASDDGCPAGTLLLRPPGAIHADRMRAGGSRNLEIEIDPSWAGHDALEATLKGPRALLDPRLRAVARSLRLELRATDAMRSLVLEGLALELIGNALRLGDERRRRTPPRWLTRARERLDAGFRAELAIGELAAEVGVHAVHLARSFRAHFGVTPGGYVRRRRLEWAAAELLRSPERPITEVALDAGFYDHSHFARAFRVALGTTPTRYRQAMRPRGG